MTRKRGNRYRRNPYNVPIRPIPDSFEEDAKEYLTNLQSLSTTGFNIKNEKGQNIPVRYKEGMLQSFEKGAWRDIVGKEVKETTTETVRETVTRASGSSSSELPVASISRIIQSYLDRHILENGKLRLDLQPFTFGNYLTFDNTTGDLTSRDTTYSAGTNITIDQNNVISATGNTYTVASPLEMNNNCISLPTVTSADEGKILKVVNGVWALAEDSTGGGGSSTSWLATYIYPNTGTSNWVINGNEATCPFNSPPLILYVYNDTTQSTIYNNGDYLYTPNNSYSFYITKPNVTGQVNCDFSQGETSTLTQCEAKINVVINNPTGYVTIKVYHRWYSND